MAAGRLNPVFSEAKIKTASAKGGIVDIGGGGGRKERICATRTMGAAVDSRRS
jgi:hypothetical protein